MSPKSVWLFKIVSRCRRFPLMLLPTPRSISFSSQYVASSVSFFFFFFTSRPFLLIFSLSEIQAVISVSVPVRTLRLLDHFGDVTAVKEVVLM